MSQHKNQRRRKHCWIEGERERRLLIASAASELSGFSKISSCKTTKISKG